MTTNTQELKGGAWLLSSTVPAIFTPEQLTEEHRLIGRTTNDFVDQEVLPALAQLEAKDWALSRRLVASCGELGLMGTDVSEAFGGVALDKASAVVVAEAMARSASFGSTFGAQTGLAIMPLVCFGTDDQKGRYLPRLVSGEWVGAYALSESGSGSDALGARTRATRQSDGSYRLSGEKMWITNCNFADVFIVFAKVDGEHFTAFIVERAFPGVTPGKEEHKMGLHGSSTAPLVLADVPVPAANVLGEVGKGHKVAFNVLNYGRFKLGAMTSGSSKSAIGQAAKYAATRRQFGQPIASFGAIKYKLSEMAARTFALESALYRIAGDLDRMLDGSADSGALLAALEEFAIEASIVKVAGSECLQYVLDENVQIHGGNGFVADYPAERQYRDSRVNRIFEGTNEINRLLIPSMFLKRGLKGELPLLEAIMAVSKGDAAPPVDGPLAREATVVAQCKSLTLAGMGQAAQRFGANAADEQEVMSWLADMVIETFLAESAVARARQSTAAAAATAGLQQDLATVFVNDARSRVTRLATNVFAATMDDTTLAAGLARVSRVEGGAVVNTVPIRRRIADTVVMRGAYPCAAW